MTVLPVNLLKPGVILAAFLLLSACTYITGEKSYYYKRKNAYLKAQDHPDLVVPAGLSRLEIADHYKIPEVSAQPGVSILPPGSLTASKAAPSRQKNKLRSQAFDAVIVDRADQAVLLVDADIKQVWPVLGDSLVRQKIKVLDANADAGKYYILNTAYMTGKVHEEDIYHINLISQDDSTLIKVTDHQGQPLTEKSNKRLLQKLMRGLKGR